MTTQNIYFKHLGLVRFGEDWINPEYVVRVTKRSDNTTMIRLVDGSIITVEEPVADVLGVLLGEL